MSSARRNIKILGIFLVLAPVVLWQIVAWTKAMAMRELDLQSNYQLHAYTYRLLDTLDKYEILPRVLTNYRGLVELLEHPSDPALVASINRYFEDLSRNSYSGVIYMLDKQGLTLAASNWNTPQSFVGKNYSFRPYFRQASAGRLGRYIAIGLTSNVLGYYVGYPITAGNIVQGVIVVKADLREQRLSLADRGTEFVVADHNGVIFLSSNPSWRFKTLQPLAPAIREQIAASRQYADIPLQPLPVKAMQPWGKAARIVTLEDPSWQAALGEETLPAESEYFVHTSLLLDRGWQIQSYSTLEVVNRKIGIAVAVAGLLLIVILLMILYWLKRREHLQALQEAAITDTLTGLHTRRYLVDAAGSLVRRRNRYPTFGIAAVLFDVDRFKLINDTYGHRAGDEVLVQVAAVIKEAARASDLAVRFGGEEFIVILVTSPEEDVMPFAQRVRQRVKALRFSGRLHNLTLTISAGVAYHRVAESLDELIERVDTQLYEAKQGGRDRVCAASEPEVIEMKPSMLGERS